MLGYVLRGGSGLAPSDSVVELDGGSQAETWTCSMHPQIQLPGPGQCPICFMDLIPVSRDERADDGPRVVSMSETARRLARIVTAPVERRYAQAVVRMVGTVDYDETRLAHIPALVPGELKRLFVDYTGIEIQEGDHMVVIDSPKLLAAQEELLQALAAAQRTPPAAGSFGETAAATVRAAREKLTRWGLTDAQVAEIEERGTAADQITLLAPIGGVVVAKNALEGTYVQVGTPIYTIADLSHVWVKLEAYESDLVWLRYGQTVTFASDALPGETLTGVIAFIDPVLDAKTRTVKVRVNVSNAERKLKPGMFVRAVVTADVAAGGRVMDASLAGRWICPMHPDVVKKAAGDCDICGMPLVTAASLGYASVSSSTDPPPLVIPASAPLITGKRAVVYVEHLDRDRPTYEGREIVLGPRAGDHYIVASGLEEGEWVVVNGAFKIDSELQIRAAPSMMSPEGGGAHGQADDGAAAAKARPPVKYMRMTGIPSEFSVMLKPIYEAYFDLQRALADDKHGDALEALDQLYLKFHTADAGSLPDSVRTIWDGLRDRIRATARAGAADDEWDGLRARFETIAGVMIDIDYRLGHFGQATHYITFCPMAFGNRGAYWLQDTESILNPYFGHAMLKCGKVTDRIAAAGNKHDG